MNMHSEKEQENALVWKEVRTEHVVRDEWIDLKKTAYEMPDGKVYEPYYTYTRKDYSVIVASDEEGKFLVVNQYRQGIKMVTNEFPAGGMESRDREGAAGPKKEEQALLCAKRELLEETGYTSDKWTHLLTVPSDATMSDNYAHLFMAENCLKTGVQQLDDMEFVRVIRCTKEEIGQMIETGRFQQAVHMLAWHLALKAMEDG